MYYNNLKFYYRKIISNYSKYPLIYRNGFDLNKTLNFNKINLVFDVGAHTGTFSQSLRRFGYKKEIISFEPIEESYEKLIFNSSKDKNWHVYKRVALGNKNKKIKNKHFKKN